MGIELFRVVGDPEQTRTSTARARATGAGTRAATSTVKVINNNSTHGNNINNSSVSMRAQGLAPFRLYPRYGATIEVGATSPPIAAVSTEVLRDATPEGFRNILDGWDAQPKAFVVAMKGCGSGMNHATLHARALDKLVELGANVSLGRGLAR